MFWASPNLCKHSYGFTDIIEPQLVQHIPKDKDLGGYPLGLPRDSTEGSNGDQRPLHAEGRGRHRGIAPSWSARGLWMLQWYSGASQ